MDRSLMTNATSQEDTPTPGYMLSEISKMTLANYQANVQVQDFLTSRLSNKNHNVKYKCLVIIKHICRTGRPEFKREMAKKTDPIKECLQFRGPPDPLRGDEIYKRVREAAKEALDAIFDSQMPVTTSAVATTNRIQGIGNDYVPVEHGKKESGGLLSSFVSSVTNAVRGDGSETVYAGHPGAEGSFIGGADKQLAITQQNNSYHGPNAGGSSSNSTIYRSGSSGMTGLGNPNFKDARDEKSWYQKAGELASSISTMTMGSSSSSPQPGHHNFQSGNPDWNYASNRGANAYGINNESYQPQKVNALGSNTSHFQQWQQRQGLVTSQTSAVVPDLPPANATGSGRVGGAATDGQYERTLIEALCEPGGLKPIPPEDKLQSFLTDAQTLSPDLVGNVLVDILNADSWQSRVKALIVIGTLVQVRECAAHKAWWKENHEEVKALCNDPKATVRNQASKTYKILTGSVVAVATGETSLPPSTGTSAKLSNGQAAKKKEESLIDMFDDMNYGGSSAPPPVSVSPTPDTPAIANAAAMGGSGVDLFSGLSISSSPQPSPLPQAQTKPAPEPAVATVSSTASAGSSSVNAISNHFDFLDDDLSISSPPPPPQQPVSPTPIVNNTDSLFSGMNMTSSGGGNPTNSGSVETTQSKKTSILDDFAGMSAPSMVSNMTMIPPIPATASAPSTGFSFISNSTSSPNTASNNAPMNSRNSVTANPASFSVISSVFVENDLHNSKNQGNDSFAQLVNLGNGSSSNSSNRAPPSSSIRYPAAPYSGQPQQHPPIQYGANPQQRYPGVPPAAPGVGGYPGYPPAPGQGGYPPAQTMNYPGVPPNPVGGGYNPGNSVLAPGMLSPMAPRKNIPTADSVGGPSGFDFISSSQAGGGNKGRQGSLGGGNDSFNFVSDLMKK